MLTTLVSLNVLRPARLQGVLRTKKKKRLPSVRSSGCCRLVVIAEFVVNGWTFVSIRGSSGNVLYTYTFNTYKTFFAYFVMSVTINFNVHQTLTTKAFSLTSSTGKVYSYRLSLISYTLSPIPYTLSTLIPMFLIPYPTPLSLILHPYPWSLFLILIRYSTPLSLIPDPYPDPYPLYKG
jgi:hypothetical protein